MAERWCNRFYPSSISLCRDGSAFFVQSLPVAFPRPTAADFRHIARVRRALNLSALVARVLSAGIIGMRVEARRSEWVLLAAQCRPDLRMFLNLLLLEVIRRRCQPSYELAHSDFTSIRTSFHEYHNR